MNSMGRRFTQYCFALAAVSAFGFSTATSQALFKNASSQLPLAAVSGPGMDVEAADVDGDGDLDIIIAHEFAPNVLLLNDGKGNFTHKAGAFAQKQNDSEDIAVADFDGDGDPDVVFVSEDNFLHEFYENDGAGNFTEIPNMLPESEANAVTVADLNNDGFKDLIIGNAGQDYVLINKATPDGGKGAWTRYFEDETEARLPMDESVTQDVEMADIDGDGDLDMICGNEDGDKILMNDGNGVFGDDTDMCLTIPANMETRKVTLGDVDSDGDLDLFLSNVAFISGKDAQDRLCINDGKGIFTDKSLKHLPSNNGHTLDGKFLDVDGDGDLDLITCDFQTHVRALVNNGSGQFSDESATLLPGELIGENLGIEIADLNGDGKQDIYIVRRGEADVLLLANGTTGIPEDSFFKSDNAFPNPFKNSTQITCELPRSMHVNVLVFNAQGEKVATLASGNFAAGKQVFTWAPQGIAKGAYFLKIEGEGFKSGGILMYSGE